MPVVGPRGRREVGGVSCDALLAVDLIAGLDVVASEEWPVVQRIERTSIEQRRRMIGGSPILFGMHRSIVYSGRLIYLFAGMSCLVIIGFFPSWFAKLLDTSLIFHVHGLLMFAWMGALIAQATLVRTRRMDLH
jgi:hypothetical protein